MYAMMATQARPVLYRPAPTQQRTACRLPAAFLSHPHVSTRYARKHNVIVRGRKRMQAGASSSGGGSGGGGGSPLPPAVLQLVASPLYRIWLQLGVVLLLAMLVDAGYSGDWSRIGVLTHEQESALQQFAVGVGLFHLVCGATAAAVSSRRGERWAPRVAKVLAVGFLALLEVLLLPEDAAEGESGS